MERCRTLLIKKSLQETPDSQNPALAQRVCPFINQGFHIKNKHAADFGRKTAPILSLRTSWKKEHASALTLDIKLIPLPPLNGGK